MIRKSFFNLMSNRRTPSFNPSLISSNFIYTSKSESFSSHNTNPSDDETNNQNLPHVGDVTSAELKSQIDKFYKGDIESIPSIFESILKRKLSGKHEDSDDELMNEFRDQTSDVRLSDEELDSGSDSDFGSDSD